MDLERFLLTGSLNKNIDKIEELYREIYTEETHNGHPMELYRYIDLQMDKRYEIFTISDVHADVRRFLEVLKKAEFINPDVDMANPIKNVSWNPAMRDKIIVICGDIIDGRRGDNNDLATNCDELLIHMLIFNLRILARAHNSYVFCTMGNHDFFAFHATDRIGAELAYARYIDSRSVKFYTDRMKLLLAENLSTSQVLYVEQNAELDDLVYIYRSYLLSRFYLIGFQPFLKINNTLFAHAGFHIGTDVFSLFEESSINSESLQPQMIHRMILEELSYSDTIIEYITSAIDNNYIISYSNYYNTLIGGAFDALEKDARVNPKREKTIRNSMKPYTDLISRKKMPFSMFDDLFLTRRLQKDCGAVDEILNMYGCNMLVVGHCPTCLQTDVFDPKNTVGITSCDDARIVYSCNSNLVTVDIAMSSAFSPNKQFLEMLKIVNVDKSVQNVCTMRYYLGSDRVEKYNEKLFDGHEWNEVP
jgi:hypothetical protein